MCVGKGQNPPYKSRFIEEEPPIYQMLRADEAVTASCKSDTGLLQEREVPVECHTWPWWSPPVRVYHVEGPESLARPHDFLMTKPGNDLLTSPSGESQSLSNVPSVIHRCA